MEDDTKYIVSLDNNTDIKYLPSKTHFGTNSSDTVPIWSVASRNNSDEFYEFQLTAEEEETVSECEENCSTDQCHICDTAVPTQFLQKHYISEKHQICAAIIRHALDRATKHSESVPFSHMENATKSVPLTCLSRDETYYCDHCSLAVKVKNKEAHEKAKEHQISAIHDRLLNGLLITYLDKSKVVASSKYEDKESDVSDDCTKDDDIVNKPVVDPDITDDDISVNGNQTDEGNQTDGGNQTNKDEDEKCIMFKDDHPKYDYVEIVKRSKNKGDATHNEQSTIEINKDFVDIVTTTNQQVRVPINNYHGFVKKLSWAEDENFDCLVCDEVFVDTEIHKAEPRHTELVNKHMLDSNCIRQINDVWHHCVLCNQKIQNKKLHVSSQLHKSKEHILEVKRKLKRQEQLHNMVWYCDICDLGFQITDKEEHLNSARHAFTQLRRVNLHYHFRQLGDETLCIVCNVIVQFYNTDKHVKSEAHELTLKKLLVTNKITKDRKGFTCYACKSKLKNKYEIDHVQTKLHKYNLSVYKPVPSQPVNTNFIEKIHVLDDASLQSLYLFESSNAISKVKCRVCLISIKTKAARMKGHLKKQYHQFNLQNLLDANEIKNRNGTYFCEACRITIDFAKEIDHIYSGDHERNMSNDPVSWRERDHVVCSALLSSTDNPASVCVSDNNTVDELFTNTTETDMKTSEHGNENSKAEDSFKFKELAHTIMLPSTDSQKQNNISETDHGNCQIYENKLTVCENTSSVPLNLTSIEDIQYLDDATTQMLYLFESSDRIGEVKCRVCMFDIKSKAAKIKVHLKNKFHQFHLQTLLDVNKIKNKSGQYFCVVCRCEIDFTKEIDHINSGYHRKNMSNNPLPWGDGDQVSSAPSSSTDNLTSKVSVSNNNTIDKMYMGSTEMGMKTSKYANESLKPRETFKFKQLMQMNNLRSMENGEIFFCDLCVEHVASKSVIEHVQGQKHLDKLIENTNEEDRRNVSQYYCEACQTRVPDIYYIKDLHNRSKQHQLNAKSLMTKEQVKVEEHKGHAADSKFDYMFEPAKDRSTTKCKICHHNLKSNKIQRHMESSMHIRNFNMFCTKNKLKLQYTGKYMCEICNKDNVQVEEILNHINSKIHKNSTARKITEFKHDMVANANSITERALIICNNDKQTNNVIQPSKENAKISNAENDVSVHKGNQQSFDSSTANNKSTKNAADSLKNKMARTGTYKVDDSFNNDGANLHGSSKTMNANLKEVDYISMNKYLEEVPSKPWEVKCKVCNTAVPKTEANIQDHLRGRRHNSNCIKFVCSTVPRDINNKQKQKIVSNKSSCDNNNETNAVKRTKAKSNTNKNAAFLQLPMLNFVDGVLFCTCCNTEVSSTQQDMNAHITDWRHEIKSSAFLAENGLTVSKDKSKLFCNICNMYITDLNVCLIHIDSPSHKMKVQKSINKYLTALKITPDQNVQK